MVPGHFYSVLNYCWNVEVASMNTPYTHCAKVPRCGHMKESKNMSSRQFIPLISPEKKSFLHSPYIFSDQTKAVIHEEGEERYI